MNAPPADDVPAIIAAFAAQLPDPASPFAILARFRVQAGAQERVETAFAIASPLTAAEPGMLIYVQHRDPADSQAFVVYERWKSLADLEAHLQSPYIRALRAEIDAVIDGPPEFRVLLPI